jgi:hypothetical protein
MTVVAGDLRSRPEQTNGSTIPAPRTMTERPRPKAIADLTLAATSTAVSVGMMFLRYTLANWERAELGDNGEAVLRELIGQAVNLTGVPEPSPRWVELDDLALLRVRLVLLDHGVIVEVTDRHDQPPSLPGRRDVAVLTVELLPDQRRSSGVVRAGATGVRADRARSTGSCSAGVTCLQAAAAT